MADVCLIAVVHGEAYERYARQLFDSAKKHLKLNAQFKMLPGMPGWPAATIYRHRILAEWLRTDEGKSFDFVYLIDADALFEGAVDSEILPPQTAGIVATLHPGYVGKPREEFPYEHRTDHACYIGDSEGEHYFCGGFLGGDILNLGALMETSAYLVDEDIADGRMPRWHDESALNRTLASKAPDVVLSPAYAHPDDDSWYRTWWPEFYARKIVMLDKTPTERGDR